MKKITFILSALLVSLSVLAVPVTAISPKHTSAAMKVEAKAADNLQNVALNQQFSRVERAQQADAANLISFSGKENAQIDMTAVKKIAQQVAEDTVVAPQKTKLAAGEAGVGIAKFLIQPGDSAVITGKYYQVLILNDQLQPIAATKSYFPMSTIVNNFDQFFGSSYDFLYFCQMSSGQYGQVISSLSGKVTLPVGTYYYAMQGFPLDATGTSVDTKSEDNDIAVAGFHLTLTGEEFAIKNAKAEAGAGNKLTMTWSNAAATLPTGSAYQVRVYEMPANTLIANSGYELTETTWSTPDSIAIKDNTSYRIVINVWSPYGYTLGNSATICTTIGTDPNAPTGLAVTVDNETMKATFNWKNTLPAYYYYTATDSAKVYNQVDILDEYGNVYVFDNDNNNTARETATSQQLPVGKFTWSVKPFYVNNGWIYIANVQGPEFEVKDVIAPVIDSVYVAFLTDSVVNLGIIFSDNNIYLTEEDFMFNVSGDITLANELEADGTLKLAGLTSKLYNIKITATDRYGNVSDEYEFAFTPVNDNEAPKNLKAEIEEGNVFDKYVVITVSAEDNIATAEELTYVLTFDDGTEVEMKAQDGIIVLEGLTPETEYTIVVKVKDLSGNESTESVILNFTTLELQPISITRDIDAWFAVYYPKYSSVGSYNYNIAFQGTEANNYLPYGGLDIYTTTLNSLTGVYSEELGNLDLEYSYIIVDGEELEIVDAELEIKFIQNYNYNGASYDYYNIYYINLSIIASDGNLYTYESYDFMRSYSNDTNENISMSGFADTDAPVLWTNEEVYPVEVNGTNVDVMFGVIDGPRYLDVMTYWATGRQQYLPTEIYSEINKLTLEIQTADGAVLASQAAGTIKNTPTLDEDGAYYFTASLSNLEPNTDYTVYIYAADEAGNEAEPIEVTFTTGEQSVGVENISVDGKPQKVLRNGNLYIIRGTEIYNATGQRVAK